MESQCHRNRTASNPRRQSCHGFWTLMEPYPLRASCEKIHKEVLSRRQPQSSQSVADYTADDLDNRGTHLRQYKKMSDYTILKETQHPAVCLTRWLHVQEGRRRGCRVLGFSVRTNLKSAAGNLYTVPEPSVKRVPLEIVTVPVTVYSC